ncbi:phosphoesterase family protein [Mycobacterium kansasii]|uniref:Phosphoesterase family protein n=1 Tax=Mycobacterium kansasii TaxID=1768 RepID=A0A1V3WZ32_MYCKA|nr:phosphoesterase family protein [Mycobacterium kansasii]
MIEKAYAAGPCSGHLTDIEHIVLCLQENRSFDHYFGTLSSVDGFDTPTPLFAQKGWNPQTQAVDPPALPCRIASIPPGGPTGLANASTTPITSGSRRICRGMAGPTTAGLRRKPEPGRRPIRPW